MEQSNQFKEKRAYKRSVFTPEENAFGIFLWPGSEDIVRVRMMNLSRDGVGFGFLRSEMKSLKVGQKLRLTAIVIGDNHPLEIPDITIEVKWVIDNSYLDHVGFGCEFVNISEEQLDAICDYVDALFPNRMI